MSATPIIDSLPLDDNLRTAIRRTYETYRVYHTLFRKLRGEHHTVLQEHCDPIKFQQMRRLEIDYVDAQSELTTLVMMSARDLGLVPDMHLPSAS